MSAWRFASSIGDDRIRALLETTTIQAICDRIAREMEVLCCHLEQCDNKSDFSRVVWCVRVGEPLFDLFFNSPNGYRGAYYQSPYVGLAVNETFIRRVSPVLLDWLDAGRDRGFAVESLSSPSAKAWLAEHGGEICQRCTGEWGQPRRRNSRDIERPLGERGLPERTSWAEGSTVLQTKDFRGVPKHAL